MRPKKFKYWNCSHLEKNKERKKLEVSELFPLPYQCGIATIFLFLPYLDISEQFPWEQFRYFDFFLYLRDFWVGTVKKNHPVWIICRQKCTQMVLPMIAWYILGDKWWCVTFGLNLLPAFMPLYVFNVVSLLIDLFQVKKRKPKKCILFWKDINFSGELSLRLNLRPPWLLVVWKGKTKLHSSHMRVSHITPLFFRSMSASYHH